MQTFPKPLASLREIVDERCERLRKLPIEELLLLAGSVEELTVDSRPATIGIIVRPQSSGAIQVVVDGSMKAKQIGRHVAVNGFYKYQDGRVTAMTNEDLYPFD